MAATPDTTAAAAPAAAARRKTGRHRGEGQWAVGHHTPLNGNEQFKKDDDGLNVRARIENIYSKAGFDSIDPNDLRGRMRWWGLYTQRKPGIDGGKTAILEPEELDDKYFMLRVRIDGGRLTTEQLRVIGEISEEFARGTADLTDRQNVQYHWIRIEDVPEIWRRLEAVGLSTTEACGDTPRVILGSPVAGIALDEIIDGTPAIDEIYARIVGNPAFSNLPRKFKSAISGSPLLDVAHEINDIAFVGVNHPEHGPGFDVWVGGGLSTNPKLGVRLGTWVSLDEVPDIYEGVISIFRDYGYRRLRTRARLKFLVADWGPAKFRQVLEDEYLKRKLTDGPAPEQPTGQWRDHVGVHQQQDGKFYVGFAPRVGRVDGATLTKIAAVAEQHGSGRLRTTAEQKMIVLDIEAAQVDSVVAALEALDLRVNPSPFRRGTMACTGIEFCKLAIVETKARGASLIDELERRLPEFAEPLTININGCPNACARIQVADIGLKGQLVLDDEGNQVEGYQVHLGGALGLEAGFGRKVRGLKVTSAGLPDYVERVVSRFEDQREDGERFAAWVTRAKDEDLS
ncbi:nitrite/sulfite reductase [Streptomyces sp. NPDC002812]|uniref:nitrite/sulfite reductase n=1 Tax=unclassified Streptomyces TaxID=2593676 RepID=UPI002030C974|nr:MULTISPECIES: nitrite/sulfite reductase [unclassified Streptomyces]MCM1970455.1 nitrite/sulfite reductase [Streptomyces sp. G1]MCX5127489.1 nitrite/sulfite reductase [Streptomyces sp. NBC_00347]MCX5295090.1 nitrite/sulfite reductase [Streptomyces sp. NBC_00193]